MISKNQNNHLLLLFSATALSYFLYPPPLFAYALVTPFILVGVILEIKIQMQLLSLFSLCAAFLTYPFFSQLLSVCALGLAINACHRINSRWEKCTLYFSICLGILGRAFSEKIIKQKQLSADIILLALTLPNFFMANLAEGEEKSRALWLINPFLDRSWAYSLGFLLGIFYPRRSIPKYIKFFLVSAFLLIQIFLTNLVYLQILSFLRGILIYDEKKHQCQLYFFVGYIFVICLLSDYLLNYMFIGYLIMGVVIWQIEQKATNKEENRNPLLDVELQKLH